ncbi:MAG: hypothetical protein PHU85_12840, partial [Phycisphaerae bacterium]|nr:hypothetical protein [Phycisphaerae bacterium]
MKRGVRITWVLLCAASAALAAVLISGRAGAEPSGGGKPVAAENPHWRDDGCKQCHELKGGEVTGPPADPESQCLACHNGKRARQCMHPAGVPPTYARIPDAAKWPLQNGRLACLTCHDARLACNKPAFRPANNAVFLRNIRPGAAADTFCANCHPPEQYSKLNPHVMLDAGGVIERRCLVCHTRLPDRNALRRTGMPLLRADMTEVCLGCHRRHSDINPKGHLGQPVTRAVSAYIRDRDIGVLYEYLKRTTTSQPDAVDFPRALNPPNTIACATCHNPHQQKTFPAESILAYGALRVVAGKSNKVAPTVPREEVCRDCHDLRKLTTRKPPATQPGAK